MKEESGCEVRCMWGAVYFASTVVLPSASDMCVCVYVRVVSVPLDSFE